MLPCCGMMQGCPGCCRLLWPAPTAAPAANILEYMECNLVVGMPREAPLIKYGIERCDLQIHGSHKLLGVLPQAADATTPITCPP